MTLVKTVCKAVHELQFRTQLEVGEIEVAAQTDFQKDITPLQLDVIIVLARKIQHRIDAQHHVWAVVVEAGSSGNEVEGAVPAPVR